MWIRSLIFGVAFLVGLGAAEAANRWVDYSPERFAEAQEAGKTTLVDVTADWCPTCKAQHPILEELATDERLKDVVFVRVDFDTHKNFLRQHRIPRQSTIVIFDGHEEVGRSVAETNRERLRGFVMQAIKQ